jgi:7,8-dihydropterin-6-yl-methyl-4-(beta-D-ribofuranosyl)aminobenzene 5'-phosphate synthase
MDASLLIELKSLTVINLVDNESDGMSSPCACIQPTPNNSAQKDVRVATYTQEIVSRLNQDDALDMANLCTSAHGLSLLLIAECDAPANTGETDVETTDNKFVKKYLLMDGGPDPKVWSENANKCKIPLHEISNVVLSHYHIDHSNGLRSAVREISQHRTDVGKDAVVVDIHQAQIETRGFKVRGKIYPMKPSNPVAREFEEMGAKVTLHKKSHVVDSCFYVSGEIPRQTDFETGLPGHFNQIDSKYGKQWVPDAEIKDERYIACKIKGRGVVVFSACSHAGIVNVCRDATEKLESKLTAAVGGFHLAGSAVEDRIENTVEALKDLNPELLLAGHCTGWRAKAKLAEDFPYTFQPLSVGGMYKFNSM